MMMYLAGCNSAAENSLLEMIHIPIRSNHVNHKTNIRDLPAHLLEEHLFPFLSADDAHNFMSSQYDHIKSILKIWNPKRRIRLLKEALDSEPYEENHLFSFGIDPAFENNYLLRYAAAKGMKDVVELLLKYPSVDPTASDGWALILAKANGHNDVYELLMQQVDQGDIESGIVHRLNSSHDLLSDIIHAGSDVPWKAAQQKKDLKLLLETSTKLLPYLENAIKEAIHLRKTDLVKMMLFFVAFDKSYFNHIVLIRQWAAGNSIKDIRKIDPFEKYDASLLISAIKNGNAELANLILDKGIKWNPFQIYMCTKYYRTRNENLYDAMETAEIVIRRLEEFDMISVKKRLKRIADRQCFYQVLILYVLITSFVVGFACGLVAAVSVGDDDGSHNGP